MNHQYKDDNTYASPKSILDFGKTEKVSRKQRIIRVLLGAMCVPLFWGVYNCIYESFAHTQEMEIKLLS